MFPCLFGDRDEIFDLWIYNVALSRNEETILRPAILMLHGGGWIHGNPLGDEGKHLRHVLIFT
jgi:acetyl esterase/lipase